MADNRAGPELRSAHRRTLTWRPAVEHGSVFVASDARSTGLLQFAREFNTATRPRDPVT
jgi:hypothetical protein